MLCFPPGSEVSLINIWNYSRCSDFLIFTRNPPLTPQLNMFIYVLKIVLWLLMDVAHQNVSLLVTPQSFRLIGGFYGSVTDLSSLQAERSDLGSTGTSSVGWGVGITSPEGKWFLSIWGCDRVSRLEHSEDLLSLLDLSRLPGLPPPDDAELSGDLTCSKLKTGHIVFRNLLHHVLHIEGAVGLILSALLSRIILRKIFIGPASQEESFLEVIFFCFVFETDRHNIFMSFVFQRDKLWEHSFICPSWKTDDCGSGEVAGTTQEVDAGHFHFSYTDIRLVCWQLLVRSWRFFLFLSKQQNTFVM